MEPPDDTALEAQFQAEFRELAQRTHHYYLRLTALEAWTLLSQIQLALRHPENTEPSSRLVAQIARRIQVVVAPEGALKIVAERGWDPQYDVPREEGMTMPEAARCAWEVTAGLIPGEPMPEYTRRWGLSSSEWYDKDGGGGPSPQGVALYNACLVAAMEYARYLMNPQGLNWVRVDWIWY